MKTSFWRLRTRTFYLIVISCVWWNVMQGFQTWSIWNWRWDNKRKESFSEQRSSGIYASSFSRKLLMVEVWSCTRTRSNVIKRSKQNVEEIEITTITRGPGLGHEAKLENSNQAEILEIVFDLISTYVHLFLNTCRFTYVWYRWTEWTAVGIGWNFELRSLKKKT